MRAWGRDQTDIAASKLSSGTFPLLVSLRHEDMRSWGELETRGEDGGRGYISSLSKLPSGMLAPSLSAACLVNQCLCRHYLLESKLSNPGVIKLMAWLSSKACQLSIVGKTELPESMKHWSNYASDFEICTYNKAHSFQTFTSLKYIYVALVVVLPLFVGYYRGRRGGGGGG